MQGALGIGSNLNKFSDEDTQLATQMVTLYKRIRGDRAVWQSVPPAFAQHE